VGEQLRGKGSICVSFRAKEPEAAVEQCCKEMTHGKTVSSWLTFAGH
jgi:hypothetical protein